MCLIEGPCHLLVQCYVRVRWAKGDGQCEARKAVIAKYDFNSFEYRNLNFFPVYKCDVRRNNGIVILIY